MEEFARVASASAGVTLLVTSAFLTLSYFTTQNKKDDNIVAILD
eukprot:CAMPEP_0184301212 /NCGR_PEP_ID=MMETSP1049-20130417/11461_1 /TAXON_ID=77928 /ORGANISM="Proteomonas sulcata, Strain CCMP704" /LENGTH=43 /DNA_ID= /DNA_START= /DNA_END= /DNA_ORIENTATION=